MSSALIRSFANFRVVVSGLKESRVESVSGQERGKRRRSYRPGVESLEALALLSALAEAPLGLAYDPTALVAPSDLDVGPTDAQHRAWDAALVASQLVDLIGSAQVQALANPADVSSGLAQMDRYLGRAWFRAGISAQGHDDCTQAVYASLLQTLGRDRFDSLLGEIGQFGIRDVLSRETLEGPDFFRAVDAVKKRAQRERSFQPLDGVDAASTTRLDGTKSDWKSTVQEAISQSLSPREAALIQATLQGESPAEIANQWGIAPKTVSNEKTRAFQKLRDALTPALAD